MDQIKIVIKTNSEDIIDLSVSGAIGKHISFQVLWMVRTAPKPLLSRAGAESQATTESTDETEVCGPVT